MSDSVAIALITGITSSVATVATLVATIITKRKVNRLDSTMKKEHALTRQSLSRCCHHPHHDVSIAPPLPRERS
jgi:hypothetical protein